METYQTRRGEAVIWWPLNGVLSSTLNGWGLVLGGEVYSVRVWE